MKHDQNDTWEEVTVWASPARWSILRAGGSSICRGAGRWPQIERNSVAALASRRGKRMRYDLLRRVNRRSVG